jgi:predicted  nucleic acid-binding Zn-ribbon protein
VAAATRRANGYLGAVADIPPTTGRRETIGALIARLAQTNIELWHEEDRARSEDDHEIARAKRRIDQLNQQRNDLVERIDEEVMRAVQSARAQGPDG